MNDHIIKEETISFPSGVNILEEGDNINNIYWIKEGEAEAYVLDGTQKIVIGEIKKGEMIGISNLFGSLESKVNVRSLTKLVVSVSEKKDLITYIETLPAFIKEVFYQLSSKIKHLHTQYLKILNSLVKLQQKEVTSLFIATQISSASKLIAKLVTKKVDGEDIILFDELVNYLEIIFFRPKEEIIKILDIFCEHSFLPIKQDSVKKFKYILPEAFSRLNYFHIFIKELNEGKYKNILKSKLTTKDVRVLMGLIRFAKNMGLDLKQEIKIRYDDIQNSLTKVTGINFDPNSIEIGQKLNLINITQEDQNKYVIINPSILGKLLSALEIRKKLINMDFNENESSQLNLSSESENELKFFII